MEIFLLWVGLSVVAAVIASNKGRSAAGFFFLALLLSPLIGILCALAVSSRADQERQKAQVWGESATLRKCPRCAELVQREAKVCRYCQADLEALDAAAAVAASESSFPLGAPRRDPPAASGHLGGA